MVGDFLAECVEGFLKHGLFLGKVVLNSLGEGAGGLFVFGNGFVFGDGFEKFGGGKSFGRDG